MVAIHWWKNHKPKQGSFVDYSTESSAEMVNLIFSAQNAESLAQATQKKAAIKIIPQPEVKPKAKSNFEVRV